MRTDDEDFLPHASLIAGLLLVVLTALTYGSGSSQQSFESILGPSEYANALLANETMLRTIIAVDDAFIAAYVTAGLLLATRLASGRRSILPWIMAASTLIAGVLDLEENHHLLILLELARQNLEIPLSEILARSDRSQLKWMIGHVGFVFAGLAIIPRTPVTKLLRVALVFVQLPVGALTWAVVAAPYHDALVLVRYLSVISGFLLIGAIARPRGELAAVDSGAPA